MVFQTIALSVITLLLFLLMLTRPAGRIKLLLGALTAVCAVVSMALFLMMQRAAGNPDDGKELLQLYIPCAVYLVLAVWGLITAALCRKKLRRRGEEGQS